jgi:DNA-binding MarR family transcriptional regulator
MKKDISESRETERIALLNQLGDLSRVEQQASNLFDERIGEFLGINRTDGRCFDIIARLGRVSAGQLANQSGLTTGAVTAVIDRLEAAGYVTRVRDPVDRRKVWVECTPQSIALIETIFGVFDLIGPLMMRHFSDAQIEGIAAFLKMGARVNRELAEGLRENTEANAKPRDRLTQARRFRRAIDALAPSIAADLDAILPPRTSDSRSKS